jgi:threonine 3-dehydrogenase
MSTMRALVKKEAKRGLWMQEVPVPSIGPRDVLVDVTHSAICGTDLHIYKWDKWAEKTIPVPMTIGHEFCGVIVEVGSDVAKSRIGQRVSAEGHVTCGVCRNCRAGRRHLCKYALGIGVNRDGSFAEYVSVPEENLVPIPDSIPSEIASIFDPLGNAVHTALSFDLVGEDVLITGAGPIGIMAAAIVRYCGARHVVITDVNPNRLALAAKAANITTVNVATTKLSDVMAQLGMKEGFDVGLEMSGNGAAFNEMVATMNNGGKISLLGIFPDKVALDWDCVIFKGLIIKGIYGREVFETWYKMGSMLQSGLSVDHVITHKLPIEDFEKGFLMMEEGSCAKVVLEW